MTHIKECELLPLITTASLNVGPILWRVNSIWSRVRCHVLYSFLYLSEATNTCYLTVFYVELPQFVVLQVK